MLEYRYHGRNLMKIDTRKTNPTKYKFSTLIAVVVLAHFLSLVLRPEIPTVYQYFNDYLPFAVVTLLAIVGFLVWFWGIIASTWEYLQASLVIMGAFFSIINASLLITQSWNAAIMWTGAVFVTGLTFRMSPVELLRGERQDGEHDGQ